MRGCCCWFAALFFIALCSRGHAATLHETRKRFAPDYAAGDKYGYAVAVSGNKTIAVANREVDNFGYNGVSAHILDTSTGQSLFKLTGHWSGRANSARSAAISGNTAVFGAHFNGITVWESGEARVFDASTGIHRFTLTASDAQPGDGLGWSVAISGYNIIAGAIGDDDAGSGSGSAYLFDANTGNELFKLTASDAAAGDGFGYSTGISGNTAVIGAYRKNHQGIISGAGYIFDTTNGDEIHKLAASDADAGDQFGWSAAISGNTAVFGAPGNADAGSDTGAAYVFDVTTGREMFKLTASDASAGDRFGASIAISGKLLVVGASGDDDAGNQSGSAYVFDTTTGKELFKLVASDGGINDLFGAAVAISGTDVVIGAWADADAGSYAGSVYFFDAIPEPATITTLLAVGGFAVTQRR